MVRRRGIESAAGSLQLARVTESMPPAHTRARTGSSTDSLSFMRLHRLRGTCPSPPTHTRPQHEGRRCRALAVNSAAATALPGSAGTAPGLSPEKQRRRGWRRPPPLGRAHRYSGLTWTRTARAPALPFSLRLLNLWTSQSRSGGSAAGHGHTLLLEGMDPSAFLKQGHRLEAERLKHGGGGGGGVKSDTM
jgi:hypothetical protein